MRADDSLVSLVWPRKELAAALDGFAHGVEGARTNHVPTGGRHTRQELQPWADAAASMHRLEVESIQLRYGDIPTGLRHKLPMLLVVRDPSPGYVSVTAARHGWFKLWAPAGQEEWIRGAQLARLLTGTLASETMERSLRGLIADTGLSDQSAARLRSVLTLQARGHLVAVEGWTVRPAPDGELWGVIRSAGVARGAAALAALNASLAALSVVAWWFLGMAALTGSWVPHWFIAWVLAQVTVVALRYLMQRQNSHLMVTIGAVLRRWAFAGSLRLDPEVSRTGGFGTLLARAMDSERLDGLVSASIALTAALVQLSVAVILLAWLPAGWVQVALLSITLTLFATWARRSMRQRKAWTNHRHQMTNDLVENMAGHRTRVSQEVPGSWHADEDASLSRYAAICQQMDRSTTALTVAIPRLWLVLAAASLAVGLDAQTPRLEVAVRIGCILLAAAALRQLSSGTVDLIDSVAAWNRLAPVLSALKRTDVPTPEAMGQPSNVKGDDVLEVVDLSCGHPRDDRPIVAVTHLRVATGDRLLLEGPSGGGKTTLAATLARLRPASSGLVLFNGLDLSVLGEDRWRKLVALAPQFHENHIFAETLLFNLLMGRRWPAEPDDIRTARALCEELGLGELVARMPAGLNQVVGEAGWRLSHGEKSRVFLARALLQDAAVTILDESFSALDGNTGLDALACARRRASALVVIAHP